MRDLLLGPLLSEASVQAHTAGVFKLDFLLTAQKAAPALLPDLIILDGDELRVAIRAGALQPLDSLFSQDLLNDLYPFATAVGRLDDRLYAVQFEADIEHLVINTDRMASPPRTWAEVLSSNHPYAFPSGQEGNPGDPFLIQYMAAGGQVGGRNAPFVLDQMALFQVLDFYAQGRARGVIPALVLGLDSTEACWPLFTVGRVDRANVLASRFLAERSRPSNIAFGPVPTLEGRPATISQGWALGIVATDAERQAATARLIEALLESNLNSAWARTANCLPTRRNALDLWNQDDPYVSFLRWQLEAAVIHPSGPSYLEVARTLAQAQRDVLSGSSTARDATERVTGVKLP